MATIVMDAGKVIEAAQKVIDTIEGIRKERNERTIAYAMGERMFSFKRGFYRMNREEAIAWINEQSCFGSWSFSIYAWSTLAEAKALLKLAQHGDPVTLNEKDIEVLF